MQLNVKYLSPEMEELITRDGDSGYDIRAAIKEPLIIDPHGRATVGTGIAVEIDTNHLFISEYIPNMPKDNMRLEYELQVRPRSGHTVKGIIAQFGTIDASYRGEIQITLFNFSSQPVTIEPNERIAQLVVCPIFKPEIITAKELTPTERGTRGFGSTGKG